MTSETISTNELANRIAGEGREAKGDHKRLAARLRSEWQRRNLVEVEDGPRRAKLIRRIDSEESNV